MSDGSQSTNEPIPFCKVFAEMQKRNVDLLTSANEIVLKSTKAMRANQVELLRMETGQISDLMIALPTDIDPSEAILTRGEQWRAHSEKMINQVRVINDLAYDCGWQLVKLCTRRIQQSVEHSS